MSLFFRVIRGPPNDADLPIETGHVIGRKGGPAHIQLDDSKISSHHAQIEGTPESGLYLVDNNSKNGLRVNGEKTPRVLLVAGVKILVGNSVLEVYSTEASTGASTQALPQATQTKPKAPEADLRTWSQILEEFTTLIMEQAEDIPKPLVALAVPAELSFFAGLQAETKWQIGYGPRKAGSHSLDMPILEPNAPENSFELIPTPQGLLFKTTHPDIVLLNDQSQGSVLLKHGDVIRIHDTKIEVGFSP